MKVYEKFWDRFARRYARQPVADQAAYEKKLKKTQALFTPESLVFEFGCGTGTTALLHAPFVQAVTAIDVSPEMIAIANEKAQGVENVHFEVGDFEGFSAGEQPFDVVMAHSILHLLKDPNAALAKAYAMLKPGGYLVSSTVCVGDLLIMKVLRPIIVFLSLFGVLPYLNGTTSVGLRERITRAGFQITDDWQPDSKSALFVIARKAA